MIETQRDFNNTEGFDWLESTELAILAQSTVQLTHNPFITMRTRPVLKCYTVFVLVKSWISTTHVVSHPEVDGSC